MPYNGTQKQGKYYISDIRGNTEKGAYYIANIRGNILPFEEELGFTALFPADLKSTIGSLAAIELN